MRDRQMLENGNLRENAGGRFFTQFELPKLDVAGSIPVARSNSTKSTVAFSRSFVFTQKTKAPKTCPGERVQGSKLIEIAQQKRRTQ